jgi:hypothetical protein
MDHLNLRTDAKRAGFTCTHSNEPGQLASSYAKCAAPASSAGDQEVNRG